MREPDSIAHLMQYLIASYEMTVVQLSHTHTDTIERFSRAWPRGRGREWATLGVHPLSWLLSNNRLEEVCGTLTTGTFSSRLLLSNQDKGCTPSVGHSLPLPSWPRSAKPLDFFYLFICITTYKFIYDSFDWKCNNTWHALTKPFNISH